MNIPDKEYFMFNAGNQSVIEKRKRALNMIKQLFVYVISGCGNERRTNR